MAKLDQFRFYVAVTPQEQLSLVAFCPLCGNSMTFSSSQDTIHVSGLQQHVCYQKIVSVPQES